MSRENGFGGGYRYALELYKREPRALLATQSVEPDWIPALEWARFQAVRECCSPQIELGEPRGGSCSDFSPAAATFLQQKGS